MRTHALNHTVLQVHGDTTTFPEKTLGQQTSVSQDTTAAFGHQVTEKVGIIVLTPLGLF